MILLILFGFLAGAGTALSPCVLPVLPAVVSAGVTGQRRRPLGLVTGLALSFTFATVALVYVIDALGLPDDFLRTLAIAVLLVFGLSLLVPPLSARIEAWLSRFARGPESVRGEGFGSGLLVGASLGLVYAPCAGPILAGVITVSASQDFTVGRLAVALAYGIGSAVVLYAIVLGGRQITDRLRPHRGQIQIGMGVVMIAVAALMVADLDIKFQAKIADDLPSALVNPTEPLEKSGAAKSGLEDVTGRRTKESRGGEELAQNLTLPDLGPAPDFTGNQRWFNTKNGEALSLKGLRGRVVLIDFWTYTCINCLRTLPYIRAWDSKYRGKGLTVVGVHTPEFPFEKKASNVEQAIRDNDLHYAVAQDNDYATWDAYQNQYWPAKYLIDQNGQVRYTHFGEGKYKTTEEAIRTLLAETGREGLGRGARARAETPSRGLTTPESYLGAEKAANVINAPLNEGRRSFGRPPRELPPDHIAYGGRWRLGADSATAKPGATLDLDFGARKVFLVLGSRDGARSMRVLLDGKPIPKRYAGRDVRNGAARISRQRLYRLVELPKVGRHRLTLKPEAGISGYAFTFG